MGAARIARATALAAGIVLTSAQASALPTEVEVTLTFHLADGSSAFQYGLPGVPFGAQGVASVDVTGGPSAPVLHLPSVELTAPTVATFYPEPGAVVQPPSVGSFFGLLTDLLLAPGSLALTGLGSGSAAGGGALPVQGIVWFAQLTSTPPHGPMTVNGSTGVGIGGPPLAYTDRVARFSIQGAPWTAGAVTLQSQTGNGALLSFSRSGFVHGPLSGTGSAVEPGGVVQFVTPVQVRSHYEGELPPPIFHTWGIFGELTLRFVPEPGVGSTFLLGALALLLLGRRRVR